MFKNNESCVKVGLVRLELPFAHLKSRPIQVIIKGILATVRPSDPTDLDSQVDLLNINGRTPVFLGFTIEISIEEC